MSRFLTRFFLFGFFALTGKYISAQIIYDPPEKKLMEFSWASPDTREYSQNTTRYDSGPFDGISVKLTKEAGGGIVADQDRVDKSCLNLEQPRRTRLHRGGADPVHRYRWYRIGDSR